MLAFSSYTCRGIHFVKLILSLSINQVDYGCQVDYGMFSNNIITISPNWMCSYENIKKVTFLPYASSLLWKHVPLSLTIFPSGHDVYQRAKPYSDPRNKRWR